MFPCLKLLLGLITMSGISIGCAVMTEMYFGDAEITVLCTPLFVIQGFWSFLVMYLFIEWQH